MKMTPLTPERLLVRAVAVPLRRPIITSQARVDVAPLLLADVTFREGVTGRAYVFAYRLAAARAIALLAEDAFQTLSDGVWTPAEAARILGPSFRLFGLVGAARMATSLLDMALWDGQAQAAGVPLWQLLGGNGRSLAAYNSCGLGLCSPEQAAREATALLTDGLKILKVRLGHTTVEQDLAVLHAIRSSVAPDTRLLVDYNQGLDGSEAALRLRRLDDLGLTWIEEPIRHDDWVGAAALRGGLRTPIQLGENFDGPEGLAAAADAGACDRVMPDLARIGGVTGWIAAADFAKRRGLPLSSHLHPEVSAHCLAASPTRDLLEYVDWADPILRQPLQIDGGRIAPGQEPGSGLSWDEQAVTLFTV
jgi:mandelate racemase